MGTPFTVRLGLAALLGSIAGCAREDSTPATGEPRPLPEQASVPLGPVTGKLLGEPFQTKTARYTVDRRPGFESVEVQLLDTAGTTACQEHLETKPRSIWLRQRGKVSIEAGRYRIGPGSTAPWEVHYESNTQGRWLGNGQANAELVLDDMHVDGRLTGSLRACFGDETQSCVKGHFKAEYCPITIDAPVRGAEAMEAGAPGMPSSKASRAPMLGSDASPIAIEPRENLLPTYPCSGCHAKLETRTKKYHLEKFHSVRNDEFSHGEDQFWCYQCHSDQNIDHLRTVTGEQVSFNEAFRICTSCHGDKLEDWRVGVHGLVLGNYNGKKFKKSCPACHDPHNPRFPLMKPLPPPAPAREWRTL